MLKELTRANWLRILCLPEQRVPAVLILRGTRNLGQQYRAMLPRFTNVLELVPRPGLILGLFAPPFLWNLSVNKEVPMNKKYIVRLTDEERAICEATIKKEKGMSEKLRRATILLKADTAGPAWNDTKISEAVGCRRQTVENVRQAFVLDGFEAALARKKRATPPTAKLLDGAAEAKLIALRLGKPPAGFGHWTLRLLADQMVELEIVESISPETVRQTLKKTA
jgi:Homeodomain-like domain